MRIKNRAETGRQREINLLKVGKRNVEALRCGPLRKYLGEQYNAHHRSETNIERNGGKKTWKKFSLDLCRPPLVCQERM